MVNYFDITIPYGSHQLFLWPFSIVELLVITRGYGSKFQTWPQRPQDPCLVSTMWFMVNSWGTSFWSISMWVIWIDVVYIRCMSMPIIWVRIHIGINCMSDIYIYTHNMNWYESILYIMIHTYVWIESTGWCESYEWYWWMEFRFAYYLTPLIWTHQPMYQSVDVDMCKCAAGDRRGTCTWHVWKFQDITGSIQYSSQVPSMNRTNRTNRHGKTSLDIPSGNLT